MAKREISCKVNAETLTVTWTAEGQEPLVLNVEKVHQDNQTYAALHGFKQRVTDAGALEAGSTVAEKFAEMRAIVEHYESGAAEWNRERAGGGGFRLDEGLVVECVASILAGGDVDRANRMIAAYAAKHEVTRSDAIKAFHGTADVKPEYAARAARRSAKVSAATMLEGIDEIE